MNTEADMILKEKYFIGYTQNRHFYIKREGGSVSGGRYNDSESLKEVSSIFKFASSLIKILNTGKYMPPFYIRPSLLTGKFRTG